MKGLIDFFRSWYKGFTAPINQDVDDGAVEPAISQTDAKLLQGVGVVEFGLTTSMTPLNMIAHMPGRSPDETSDP